MEVITLAWKATMATLRRKEVLSMENKNLIKDAHKMITLAWEATMLTLSTKELVM